MKTQWSTLSLKDSEGDVYLLTQDIQTVLLRGKAGPRTAGHQGP